MQKTLLSLLCTTLLIQYLQAEEQYPFIGLSVSSQTIGYANRGESKGEDEHSNGISLHYGKQTQEWRTLFSIDYLNDTYTGFGVEIDKVLMDSMFGTPKLRPYLGLSLGYIHFDNLDDAPLLSDETKSDLESNGFYYGGNFGFLIYTTDRIDVDLNYHYYRATNLDYLDDIHGATLSVHYFY